MSRLGAGLGQLRAAGGFFTGLGPFLRRRPAIPAARLALERGLETREQRLAFLLRHAVFGRPRSPYRALFGWAGIELDEAIRMLEQSGLEETLCRLHRAGVRVGLEEFKGLRPLARPGLELPLCAEDFDNPLGAGHYESRTGGSGGAPRRILIGLELLEHETAYHALFYAGDRFPRRPAAMWLPAPPGAVGIKNALIRARLGLPVARWYSQTDPAAAPARHRAFAGAVRLAARAHGSRIPLPEHTPPGQAGRVADFLATARASDGPAVLLTTPSSAVRICAAAADRGLDIAGTLFVVVGEPWTAGKAGVIARAGCTGASHYAMVEAGMIGLACRRPTAPDDVHLVSDKIATIESTSATSGSNGVPALFHTTLLPSSPKLMLNVESGDHGTLEERDCGCGVLPPGYRRHLHSIRSHEKLTSEGMHFLGADLLVLLEQVLPERFGGRPTDFQLVEGEIGGIPRVSLVVSPAVGPLDAGEAVRVTLDFLRRRGVGQRLMAEVWESGGTIEVVRAEPHVTPAGKIQPLQRLWE